MPRPKFEKGNQGRPRVSDNSFRNFNVHPYIGPERQQFLRELAAQANAIPASEVTREQMSEQAILFFHASLDALSGDPSRGVPSILDTFSDILKEQARKGENPTRLFLKGLLDEGERRGLLTERERAILAFRYQLEEMSPEWSLAAAIKKFGRTRARIQQEQAAAEARLKGLVKEMEQENKSGEI